MNKQYGVLVFHMCFSLCFCWVGGRHVFTFLVVFLLDFLLAFSCFTLFSYYVVLPFRFGAFRGRFMFFRRLFHFFFLVGFAFVCFCCFICVCVFCSAFWMLFYFAFVAFWICRVLLLHFVGFIFGKTIRVGLSG